VRDGRRIAIIVQGLFIAVLVLQAVEDQHLSRDSTSVGMLTSTLDDDVSELRSLLEIAQS